MIRRAAKYKTTIENAGGKLVGEYYTFGKYDIVTIVDAPGDVRAHRDTQSISNI
jgi:uncharacterized protein with GYD domain